MARWRWSAQEEALAARHLLGSARRSALFASPDFLLVNSLIQFSRGLEDLLEVDALLYYRMSASGSQVKEKS